MENTAVHSREKEIIEASSVFVHPRVLRNCNWWLSLLLCCFAGNYKRSFRGGPTHSGALYCMVTIRRLCPPHKDQHTLAEPKTEPRRWGGGEVGRGIGGPQALGWVEVDPEEASLQPHPAHHLAAPAPRLPWAPGCLHRDKLLHDGSLGQPPTWLWPPRGTKRVFSILTAPPASRTWHPADGQR